MASAAVECGRSYSIVCPLFRCCFTPVRKTRSIDRRPPKWPGCVTANEAERIARADNRLRSVLASLFAYRFAILSVLFRCSFQPAE